MAPKPIIDLEALNLRRAEEMMQRTDILKAEIGMPSDRGELHHSARLTRE